MLWQTKNPAFRSGFVCLTTCPQMRRSVSCGHDDGELPIRDVHLESTCARGSHVCCDACAVMVGMFFSYLDIFIFSFWECKGSIFDFKYKIFFIFLCISHVWSRRTGLPSMRKSAIDAQSPSSSYAWTWLCRFPLRDLHP